MMAEKKIQKRTPGPIKETGQYLLAFGVIASMLLVVGFPLFVIFFLGIFAYFLWKIFSAGSNNETREIFEFYLAANDILRDDERRWYGFEIREAIHRGERVLELMTTAPPLVHFSLGALYNKAGDHSAAVKHLSYLLENNGADEKTFVYPSPELRSYVRVLRKIEREPAEAPLTSGAVRALERARKNRGRAILDDSRSKMPIVLEQPAARSLSSAETAHGADADRSLGIWMSQDTNIVPAEAASSHEAISASEPRHSDARVDPSNDRKPILEVLHDIYDKNVQ
jgi:hypothetical protein